MNRLLLFLLSSMLLFSAQAVSLPFFCGFEAHDDIAEWNLVNGTNRNAWVIGEATSLRGQRSLYISADGGLTMSFVRESALSVAYREFILPRGQYEISFDYRMQSVGNTLYVVWITDENFDIAANTTGIMSSALHPIALPVSPSWRNFTLNVPVRNFICSPNCVNSGTLPPHVPCQPGCGVRPERARLAFFWSNITGATTPISAAIDNVQIGSLASGTCARPFPASGALANPNTPRISVAESATGVRISWWARTWFGQSGRPPLQSTYALLAQPDTFDIKVRNIHTHAPYEWMEFNGIVPTLHNDTLSYEIPRLPQGIYTIWVRGRCGNQTSIWAISDLYISVRSAEHCINFIDLRGAGARAATGNWGNPHMVQGIVDFGEFSWDSRHTINITPYVYDPHTIMELPDGRTIGLRTIPENNVASVRIGNMATSTASESITYTFTICENSEIIVLQYAMVMEGAHILDYGDANIRFELLDMQGRPLSGPCTCRQNFFYCARTRCDVFRFDAGSSLCPVDPWIVYMRVPNLRDGWHHIPQIVIDGRTHRDVYWKEWTDPIGFDVSHLMGETIQVRITTRACLFGAHWGYAYFTLDCGPRRAKRTTCGADATDERFEAPEGFKYEWFIYPDMETVIYTGRVFELTDPNDTNVYIVRVRSGAPGGENCFFELDFSAVSRLPRASFNVVTEQSNCQNFINFEDVSYVFLDAAEPFITTDPIEEAIWDFGGGVVADPVNRPMRVRFDNPGWHTVSLAVSIGEGACLDTLTRNIYIPELRPVVRNMRAERCDYFIFSDSIGDVLLTTTGIHNIIRQSPAGCNDTIRIDLTIHRSHGFSLNDPASHRYLTTDTICFGTSRPFQGQEFRHTGTHTVRFNTIHGCDSVYTLNLTVLPEMRFSYRTVKELEGNDAEIILYNLPPNFTHYEIHNEQGIRQPSLQDLQAGWYYVTVFGRTGSIVCSRTERIQVSQTCLEIEIQNELLAACSDAAVIEFPFTVIEGAMRMFSVDFCADARQAGFVPAERISAVGRTVLTVPMPGGAFVPPGHYIATFSFPEQLCDTIISRPFTIQYPTQIIVQRWNDVLQLRGSAHNGGFAIETASFQWYMNDVPIPGATRSYLYFGNLSPIAEYRVAITHLGRKPVFSCPVVPTTNSGFALFPTIISRGSSITIEIPVVATATLVNSLGVRMGVFPLQATNINEIQLDVPQGVYLLHIVDSEGERYTVSIVVN